MKASSVVLQSGLGTATEQLVALGREPDPFIYGPSEIGQLQMRAIRERFDLRRRQINVLDQRAKDLGIGEINTLQDLVPLLFSHQTYKSYPESFIRDNKWDQMNRWFDTLSAVRVGNIDVSDITSTDAWVVRLSEHGHHVLLSSGTSGKASFLNRSERDRDFIPQDIVKNMRLMQEVPEGQLCPAFLLGPQQGTHIFVPIMRRFAAAFGRPDATYWLSELPLTEADIRHQAELRRKMTIGSATPGEMEEFGKQAQQRQEHMCAQMKKLAQELRLHRGEPVFIAGFWLPLFMLMEEARREGMSDGELHPKSFVFNGGGTKGAKLPPDYLEQVTGFLGLDRSRYFKLYGMSEMSQGFPACKEGRYHCTPWNIPMILDREGEKLLNPAQGTVEGRMAFFDVAVEARWGGIISGDKVEVDFSPCPCGRRSASVKSIVRYTDLEGGDDDKLSCAGTMSSYVRGAIEG